MKKVNVFFMCSLYMASWLYGSTVKDTCVRGADKIRTQFAVRTGQVGTKITAHLTTRRQSLNVQSNYVDSITSLDAPDGIQNFSDFAGGVAFAIHLVNEQLASTSNCLTFYERDLMSAFVKVEKKAFEAGQKQALKPNKNQGCNDDVNNLSVPLQQKCSNCFKNGYAKGFSEGRVDGAACAIQGIAQQFKNQYQSGYVDGKKDAFAELLPDNISVNSGEWSGVTSADSTPQQNRKRKVSERTASIQKRKK